MKEHNKIFLILLALIVGSVFTILYMYRCPEKKVINNRMKSDRIVIIAVDTVDGRPVYNVLFEDEDVMDSMYGEEIGSALSTGHWEYNEDLRVK